VKYRLLFFRLLTLAVASSSFGGERPGMRVSDNHRFLVTGSGWPHPNEAVINGLA